MKAEKYEMEAANDILREKNQPISTYTYMLQLKLILFQPVPKGNDIQGTILDQNHNFIYAPYLKWPPCQIDNVNIVKAKVLKVL